MILLTRLNGTQIIVNADMIEFIEDTPDTVVSMSSGKKLLVTEDTDTIIQKFIEHKKKIFPYIDFKKDYDHLEKIDCKDHND